MDKEECKIGKGLCDICEADDLDLMEFKDIAVCEQCLNDIKNEDGGGDEYNI